MKQNQNKAAAGSEVRRQQIEEEICSINGELNDTTEPAARQKLLNQLEKLMAESSMYYYE
jgi:anti-anti-sigma regulatory factor